MKGSTSKLALCALTALASGGALSDTRTLIATGGSIDLHPRCVTAATGMARLPLQFEINRGQSPLDVTFAARGRGYGIFLTRTGAVLTMASSTASGAATVRMTFAGANPTPD